MSRSLIIEYLNGADNLERIRCISLWSRREVKKALLFVNSKDEMFNFVDKLRDFNKPTRDKNKVSDDRTTITFTRNYPYGNAFLIKFAKVNNICIDFM